MKNMWIILLLCVAVVALSVRLMIVSNKESKADAKTASEDVIECIMTRASVRKYTSEPVADSLITTVLKAGMAAPTAVNQQAWHFVVIKDQTLKDKISDSFQWAKMVKGCAFAVVVCGDMAKLFDGDWMPRLRRRICFWQLMPSASAESGVEYIRRKNGCKSSPKYSICRRIFARSMSSPSAIPPRR